MANAERTTLDAGVGRAKDSRQLREDFTSRDLVLLLMANAGVLGATADAAPDAWRRLVAWMIQSFQAPPPARCRTRRKMRRCTRPCAASARAPPPPSPESDAEPSTGETGRPR
jgi:hypothetical protein